MSRYHGYSAAVKCATGPQPGAKELMSWFLARYAAQGGANGGIYDCKLIPGSRTLSVHGEGRADDLMTYGAGWGKPLALALVDCSGELGIQCVIYDRHIWSGSQPDMDLYDRAYPGSNPHTDHIHAELSWDAAKFLTAGRVETILGSALNHPPMPAPMGDDPMFTFQRVGQPEIYAASAKVEHISQDTADDLKAAGIKHVLCNTDRSFAQVMAAATPPDPGPAPALPPIAADEIVDALAARIQRGKLPTG